MVRRGGGPHRWPLHPEPSRNRAHRRHQTAGRPVLRDHAVELPTGHGYPQDRSCARGGVHHDRQAGSRDAADHAAASQVDDRGGAALRCALGAGDQQAARGHHRAHRRRPAAQTHLHGLDRRRQGPGEAIGGEAAAHLDGTRRQRPVRGVRRRRCGCRRRWRDAGQDAQRWRGLHCGESAVCGQPAARRVHRQIRQTDG